MFVRENVMKMGKKMGESMREDAEERKMGKGISLVWVQSVKMTYIFFVCFLLFYFLLSAFLAWLGYCRLLRFCRIVFSVGRQGQKTGSEKSSWVGMSVIRVDYRISR